MLDKMYTWFAVNRLTLNTFKTNDILLGNRMLRKYVICQYRKSESDNILVCLMTVYLVAVIILITYEK